MTRKEHYNEVKACKEAMDAILNQYPGSMKNINAQTVEGTIAATQEHILNVVSLELSPRFGGRRS